MALSKIETHHIPPLSKGPSCSVCAALDTLPEAEAAALRSLLADPQWRYQALADALRADEDTPLDIAASTLARHARGNCAAREKLR